MLCLKQENIFRSLDIELLKIENTQNFISLPHCLTTFASLDAKHRTASILWHKNKLTSEMFLLEF